MGLFRRGVGREKKSDNRTPISKEQKKDRNRKEIYGNIYVKKKGVIIKKNHGMFNFR